MQIEVVATKEVALLYSNLRVNNPLKKQIEKAKVLFEDDNNVGNYIVKKLWPKKYTAHDVPNLYRFPLGRSHRMIYTVRGQTGVKKYQILDVLTHTEYDRIFGY